MPVVADSTILMRLGRVQQLDLLLYLYRAIMVPQRVWEEVVVDGHGLPGSLELAEARDAGWVTVQAPSRQEDVDSLINLGGLDLGERQAIALAVELNPSLLLIDEEIGYTKTQKYFARAIRVASLLHVLDECVRRNLVAKDDAERIVRDSGYKPAPSVLQDFKARRDQRAARWP